jgi:hypothetical protein
MDRLCLNERNLLPVNLQAVSRPSNHQDSRPCGWDQAVYEVVRNLPAVLWQQPVTMALQPVQKWCLEQRLWPVLLVEQVPPVEQATAVELVLLFQPVTNGQSADSSRQHLIVKGQVHCLTRSLLALLESQESHERFHQHRAVARQHDGVSSGDFLFLMLRFLHEQQL